MAHVTAHHAHTPLVWGSSVASTTAFSLMLLLFISTNSLAADDNAMFIPRDMKLYNPQKNNNPQKNHDYNPLALNNLQLEQEADFMRDHQMSTEQRALNHQWLAQDDAVEKGNKVISKLLKMGFKAYWSDVHDSHYSGSAVPDESGEVYTDSEVKYRLRLSSSRARVEVKYEF